MRILFSVHLYVPQHGAGGELYVHNMAKYLLSQGHEVRVLHHDARKYNIDEIYCYEGVEVFPPENTRENLIKWADLVITHLGYTSWTVAACKIYFKPCIFISHNTWVYDVIVRNEDVGVIYNSNAMRETVKYPNASIVLHPATDFRKYDIKRNPEKNKFITLINLNKNKGSKIFFNIARAMPDRQFLAVRGGYDPQYEEKLANVTIIDNTPDMVSNVYAKTRILLIPSKYESWGMCATEAMASGIPVIYSPTFGLCENVGESGIQVPDPNPKWEDPDLGKNEYGQTWENPGIDPSNFMAWVKKIKILDNRKKYQLYSRRAKARSRQLDPSAELAQLLPFFYKIIENNAKVVYQRLIS